MKRDHYETFSRDDKRYETLARQAGASDNHELADFFRGLRDGNRGRAEGAGRLRARRVAE